MGDIFLWQDTVVKQLKPNPTLACLQKVILSKDKNCTRKPVDIACGCNHIVLVVQIN